MREGEELVTGVGGQVREEMSAAIAPPFPP